MLTKEKGRGRSPWPLLTLLLCLALAVGLGAAAPAFALTLSGTVANDTNANGVLDATDARLGGVTVALQPAAGGVAATTISAADGTYSFSGLASNMYTVTVGSSPGLNNETPASVTVALSADRSDVNILFVIPGLIGGRVVSDLNGNGIAEPTEPGLPGVSLDLNRLNPLGQPTLIATVVTGTDGTFFFPIQPAGTYTVVAHPAAGAVATGANAGSSGTATVLDANNIRVILNVGQSAAGLRFSERTPQTIGISGFVRDSTNMPLPMVKVELRDASQNLLDFTFTDANGQYFFGSVAPGGTYIVRAIPPPGFSVLSVSPTAPATADGTSGILVRNFSPSTIYGNNNFVLGASSVVSPVTPGAANAISGKVINDLNGNGMFNGGEPGLAGATLTLVAASGVSYGTTVTGSGGDFTFVNLPAGTYTLTRTNPSGYVSTGVQPGVGGTSLNVDTIRVSVTGSSNLFSGQLFLASTNSITPPPTGFGTISGSVVQDLNGNNSIDFGDLPLSSVPVLLVTQGGGIAAQSFTDVNGAYAFTNVSPGTYLVEQQVPANFTAVAAFAGPGGVAVSPTAIQVSISNGISGNNNFLDRATVVSGSVGTISGSVIQDVDHNGVIDAGDAPLQGVSVQLITQLNVPVAQAFTDVNGAYAFTNVPPGFYQVVQAVPAGLTSVAAFPGINGFAVSGSTNALAVTVVAGVNSGNNNFLDASPAPAAASISGSVVVDTDGNGVVDAGDAPLANVAVQLRNQFGQFISQFFTDVHGAFIFNGLTPGTYQVVQVVPANYAAIGAFPGPGGSALSATTLQVTTSGGVSGNNNFLDRATVVSPTVGTISGSVVRDVDNSGAINIPPDVPIPGVTVQLFTQANTLVGQTTTDVNGAYAFTNVPPGFYEIMQIVPSGLAVVGSNPLAVTAVAGVNQGNNNFLDRSVSVTSGANTISGFAIRDLNLNGSPNNDPGLAGMQITLINQFGTALASVVTNATGIFTFTNVPSGTFTLTATPPLPLASTNAIAGQGGTRLSASSISVTTTAGVTNYPGQLFLAGP
jgi:protocatechuate 3,4-dioxygenase beta subunit